jgi:PAS domain S-box-containing protein
VPQFAADVSSEIDLGLSGWGGYKDGSALVFPLLGDDRQPFGVVTLHNRTPPPFTEQDLDVGTIIVSVVTAVLRKREAGEALKRSESRFRNLVEKSTDIITVVDAQGVILLESPSTGANLGWERGDLTGTNVLDLAHPGERRQLAAFLKRLSKPGAVSRLEHRLRDKDGNYRVLLSDATNLTDNPEIGGIVINSRDITSWRMAELALGESEAKYKTLFEAAGDGIIMLDGDRFVDCNQGACELFGLSREGIVGKKPHELSPPTQADGTPSIQAASERLKTALSGDGTIHFEWSWLRSNGEVVESEIALTPVVLQDKPYLQAIVRDISARKRAEELERQQDRQLFQAAKMASLGTLVSGVAHEINNPNNIIRLSTENLADLWSYVAATLRRTQDTQGPVHLRGIPLDSAERMVESILQGLGEGSVRIEQLVRALREYSKTDEGQLNQLVDLNVVVESAQTIVRSALQNATVHYSFVPAPDLPPVSGNLRQIEQVVINLLTNACQALDTTEGAIRVVTGLDRDKSHVFVEIQDEGVGISEQNLLRITDPFYTTKRNIGGTGLGLSVCQRIVKSHGGELLFSSSRTKGTVARVVLPVGQRS